MNKFRKGQRIERLVAKKLKSLGYKILAFEWHSPYGEIDIVAIDFGSDSLQKKLSCLVLVEVKARSTTLFGQPYDAVTASKLNKIIKTGEMFRSSWVRDGRSPKLPVATRVDVVSVMLNQEGKIETWNLMKNVTR